MEDKFGVLSCLRDYNDTIVWISVSWVYHGILTGLEVTKHRGGWRVFAGLPLDHDLGYWHRGRRFLAL